MASREILIVGQGGAGLIVEIVQGLAQRNWHCRLLTNRLPPDVSVPPGTQVLVGKELTRDRAWKRVLSWGLFSWQAILTIIRHRKCPVLITTTPPFHALFLPLLQRLFGVRYCYAIYDVFPDVMERMELIRSDGLISRFWKALNRRAMLRASCVITIGESMAKTLRHHLKAGDGLKIEVIPTWVDIDHIHPLPKEDNPFAIEHGLLGKFVVMYSGNFGATHDVDSLIGAAELLRDLPDVHFMLIGDGQQRGHVAELVAKKQLPNLTLLPLQRRDLLPYSLTAADCAIASLDEVYAGISVPSKTAYILAAGAVLLAVGPRDTELEYLVRDHKCGVYVPPRDAPALATAVRNLYQDRVLLGTLQRNARETAERMFSKKVLVTRYVDCLEAAFSAADSAPRIAEKIAPQHGCTARIVPMSPEHCEQVVDLHMQHLRSSMRGWIGRGLLRSYYLNLLAGRGGCAYVAAEDDRVLGFVGGVWNSRVLRARLVLHFGLRIILLTLLEYLGNPRLLISMLDRMAQGGRPLVHTRPGYELRPIAVSPEARGSGVAGQLVDILMADAARRGHDFVFLVTELDNIPARKFYPKVGFVETGRVERFDATYVRYERRTSSNL